MNNALRGGSLRSLLISPSFCQIGNGKHIDEERVQTMLKKLRNMARKNKTAGKQDEKLQQQAEEDTLVAEKEQATEQAATSENKAPEENGAGDEMVELQQQLGELKEKYMRLYAEFDNYKKRSIREKTDWMKTAAQDTMAALLPVLDDFDRAKKFAGENNGEGWSDGIELLYHKLYNTLKGKDLHPMESTGEAFDPEFHDAITEIPAPSDDMKGKVIDTIEKGYRLNDKIIRHAKVVVGK
jgi:molecular chaperone GrpE